MSCYEATEAEWLAQVDSPRWRQGMNIKSIETAWPETIPLHKPQQSRAVSYSEYF